ncbi:Uncharacterised protein [Serratia ficaria]|nr:Uncharacterised protein [Serratia ficaria]
MVRKAAKKSLLDYKSFRFSVLKIILFEVIEDGIKDLILCRLLIVVSFIDDNIFEGRGLKECGPLIFHLKFFVTIFG